MTNDLIFEPYAVQQNWRMPGPLASAAWTDLFSAYLVGLADACNAAGASVIGHIKLLALFPDGDYLRISAVSPSHAPTVTGAAPDGLAELSTTLNVLVYGLPRDVLQTLSRDAAAFLANSHAGQVIEDDLGMGITAHHEHSHFDPDTLAE